MFSLSNSSQITSTSLPAHFWSFYLTFNTHPPKKTKTKIKQKVHIGRKQMGFILCPPATPEPGPCPRVWVTLYWRELVFPWSAGFSFE